MVERHLPGLPVHLQKVTLVSLEEHHRVGIVTKRIGDHALEFLFGQGNLCGVFRHVEVIVVEIDIDQGIHRRNDEIANL